jgi:putative ABC transport system permease protein
MDEQDVRLASKAALVTERFAVSQFGGVDDALGKVISLSGIPFQIIGAFTEGFNTYGQSETIENTILIPYKVALPHRQRCNQTDLYFCFQHSAAFRRSARRLCESSGHGTDPKRCTKSEIRRMSSA